VLQIIRDVSTTLDMTRLNVEDWQMNRGGR
jgi:hypothetical protein